MRGVHVRVPQGGRDRANLGVLGLGTLVDPDWSIFAAVVDLMRVSGGGIVVISWVGYGV